MRLTTYDLRLLLCFLFSALILSSCGFQVIYKEREESVDIAYVDELAKIRIQKDRTRLGQKMKNNLYDILNPDSVKAEPKYFLVLTTNELVSSTYITTTGASGRSKVTLNVGYRLKDLKTGEVISEGDTSVNDNYDMTTNRYGTYKAGNYIQSNLTKIAAQNIRNSIVNDLIELRRKCSSKVKEASDSLCESVKTN